MKRKILVVYQGVTKYGNCLGNVDCTVNYDVPNIEDIREIERQIREAYHISNVVVLNIIELAAESEGEG